MGENFLKEEKKYRSGQNGVNSVKDEAQWLLNSSKTC